jgi:hypothetical protein
LTLTPLELAALWLVRLLAAYAGIGLLFALCFAARGVERIDPAARGASLGFRLLVLPGAVALWPLLARRWALGRRVPVERNAHRAAAAPSGTDESSEATVAEPRR